ncbi:hypothetical protein [Streptomyces lavendulae]|uniref:hypothetical protein n=1 Tax=Streptomyces lavendulae TaxID=1914 RepID=UPI0033D116A6
MIIRQMVKARSAVTVAVVAVLAVTVAGCGSGGGKAQETPKAPQPQSQGASGQSPAAGKGPSAAATTVIAQLKGQEGMTLEINSVQRDSGGFLTVNGQLKNAAAKVFNDTAPWRGVELQGTGESVAGATLVDKVGKKRYYVLRDTESRCLCTTGVSSVDPGQAVTFFAQFPAPPASTSEVEFSMPTFTSATVKISG